MRGWHRGRTKCERSGRSILVGKIYERILVDRVNRVTGGLIDDEHGGFRADLHTKADR